MSTIRNKRLFTLILFLLSLNSYTSQQTPPPPNTPPTPSERAASPIPEEPPSPTPTIAYTEEMLAENNGKKRKHTAQEEEERTVRARIEEAQQQSAPTLSSDQQIAQEFFEAGNRYYVGTAEAPKKPEVAKSMWQEASKRGHQGAVEALKRLAKGERLYERKTVQELEKLAETNDTEALTELGYRYRRGIGAEQNLGKAVHSFKQAAAKGHKSAQESLARLSRAVNIDQLEQEEAQVPAVQAIAAPSSSSTMQVASSAASSSSIMQAIPASSSSSLDLNIPGLEKAAEAGNPQAQFNLGARYKTGLGVKKDLKKAAKLYQQAADQDFATAQVALGALYETGQGVQKNLQEAVKLYEKAAKNGLPKAQQALARLKKASKATHKQ
jgi:hypothetical protein